VGTANRINIARMIDSLYQAAIRGSLLLRDAITRGRWLENAARSRHDGKWLPTEHGCEAAAHLEGGRAAPQDHRRVVGAAVRSTRAPPAAMFQRRARRWRGESVVHL